ncbi:sugar fermentation stimulation protein A [Ignicoccus pacificus DSM 13166]|uniref:Sugar fermentation stimulation protein A n=1 Tax=Ignicoccus pacificus DSM 13166 TaxID=940294 RepID=A0A977K916_9CREN|nr:sugar fermentation stimulation protein A [Ignicoccus pacificus DSM 13166]
MQLLKLETLPCTIIRKLNRFVIEARIGNEKAKVHNTNTGRLEDLIWEGNLAYCSSKSSGKTKYKLVAAQVRDGGFAVVDTNLQEMAFLKAYEMNLIHWLKDCSFVRRRPRLGKGFSDFEFSCNGTRTIVELKSADLKGPFNEAMWPDCPTERGKRHLLELGEFVRKGNRAVVTFIAGFPGACCFRPYLKGDPEVLDRLLESVSMGVEVRVHGMYFDPFTSTIKWYGDLWPYLG